MDPSLQWIILCLFIAFCVLASLKTLASALKRETDRREAEVEAARIREQYEARLKEDEEGARTASFGRLVPARFEPARKAA